MAAPKKLITWLDRQIDRVERENEENDYRVFWEGNDIDGCDALRVLKTVRRVLDKC